jgi:hypothetical protein
LIERKKPLAPGAWPELQGLLVVLDAFTVMGLLRPHPQTFFQICELGHGNLINITA